LAARKVADTLHDRSAVVEHATRRFEIRFRHTFAPDCCFAVGKDEIGVVASNIGILSSPIRRIKMGRRSRR